MRWADPTKGAESAGAAQGCRGWCAVDVIRSQGHQKSELTRQHIVHREYISTSLSWCFFLHVYMEGERKDEGERHVCVDI